jgi:Zn-dependent protease with chaperone function
MNFNSRRNEFAADKYAQELGMADALGRGLVKISVGELQDRVWVRVRVRERTGQDKCR